MRASYQEMFDEVRASGRLKEEVLNMTKQEKTRVARKVSASFVIAAALAVILAGTALAAVTGVPETLQEWFGRQWTEAGDGEEMPGEQAAVVEGLVQPVGVTSSGYGVTVTLDSVTPGDNGLWMLLKVKGEVLRDPWQFVRTNLSGNLIEQEEASTTSSMAIYPLSSTEDGALNMVILYDAPDGISFLKGGRLVLELNDIVLRGEWPEAGEQPEFEVIEGSWALPFILKPAENRNVLTAKSAMVPCGWDDPPKRTEIRDIRVTVTGVSFTEVEKEGDENSTTHFDIVLQMKDGLEIRAMGGASGMDGRYNWKMPVDLAKVESIRFGDVVVPLKPSGK